VISPGSDILLHLLKKLINSTFLSLPPLQDYWKMLRISTI
jgi:hypothetical protein